MEEFRISLIVLDDVAGEQKAKQKVLYDTAGRHDALQVITVCHKACHIDNLCRISTLTIYITRNESPAFLK